MLDDNFDFTISSEVQFPLSIYLRLPESIISVTQKRGLPFSKQNFLSTSIPTPLGYLTCDLLKDAYLSNIISQIKPLPQFQGIHYYQDYCRLVTQTELVQDKYLILSSISKQSCSGLETELSRNKKLKETEVPKYLWTAASEKNNSPGTKICLGRLESEAKKNPNRKKRKKSQVEQ